MEIIFIQYLMLVIELMLIMYRGVVTVTMQIVMVLR